jgi:imidazolonepropionase-like amidohydrolase
MAKPLGLTVVDTPPIGEFDDTRDWTDAQLARARRGYEIMASYVAVMHSEGVLLAVGTDTVDPGSAVLSEMILLHEAGIPMAEVLRIATLGGAEVMEISDVLGSVEPGKRAHFVLFDDDPLEKPAALLGGKTVVKDGVVWEGQ